MFSLYADLFGEQNVLAVPVECLSSASPEFLDKIYGHLGVDPIIKEIGWNINRWMTPFTSPSVGREELPSH